MRKWIVLAAAVVVVLLALGWRWRKSRDIPPSVPHLQAGESERSGLDERLAGGEQSRLEGDLGKQLKRAAAENFALLQERAALKKALLATTTPVVAGLPTPPAPLYNPEELRLLDDIHQRVFSEVGQKLAQLHREVKGAPPPDVTPQALFGTMLDSAGVSDVQALIDQIAAVKKLKEQNAAPGPDAPLAQRILWLLTEAGDTVEREVKDALPPARHEELARLPYSGFGYSVRQNDGHWAVAPALPRPHP